MDNVRKIRKDKGLYFILDHRRSEGFSNEKIAVFVNLYYLDMVEYCLKYLERLDQRIDIYIASSNLEVLEKTHCIVEQHGARNIRLWEKDNRGRDVSALLVTFRNIAMKYEFFCFIHDKKEKRVQQKADIDLWVRNLWGNTLESQCYVDNVMDIFAKNPQVGLLVPPEPIGADIHTWYINTWFSNFEPTVTLADKLNLDCEISCENAPITIGTVFWTRSPALKKLLETEWRYEDFPPEPMPVDGTLGHAVERVLAYVAQDAGYDTGTIMTAPYAEKQLAMAQEHMYKTYRILDRHWGVGSLRDLRRMDANYNLLSNFCSDHSPILLYGAGLIAKSVRSALGLMGFAVWGIVVTEKQIVPEEICGLPIMEIDDLVYEEGMGIIISVNSDYRGQVIDELEKRGIKEYTALDWQCV